MNILSESKIKKPTWLLALAFFVILFGAATIKEGGTVLFTEQGKTAAGHYVPFVLWFNFIAGFIYIIAGIAIFRLKSCVRRLSAVIAISTSIVFVLFLLHILNGGAYEMRTVLAMTIRSSLWIYITAIVFKAELLKPVSCHC